MTTTRHTTLFRTALLCGALLCALPGSAAAQGAPDPPPPDSPVPGNAGIGYIGAELGFGQVDEDFFLTFNLTGGLRLPVPKLFCGGILAGGDTSDLDCGTHLKVGLRLPLRLRIVDQKPNDPGTLRSEDWDEAGDFARLVRFVEYGSPTDPVYGRLGEFEGAVLGHGTIMNRYFNVLFVDHYQLGLALGLGSRVGRAEFVMDNLLDPQVFGYRLAVRPWEFFDPSSWGTRYSIGTSLVMDLEAPVDFRRVSIEQNAGTPFEVTDSGRLIPIREASTGVFGIDHELTLVTTEEVDFVPYIDTNFHINESAALHIGAMTNLRPVDGLGIYSKLELRFLGEKYLPVYFGALYEVERDATFGFGGQGRPKLVVLRGLEGGARAGAYGEVMVSVLGLLEVTGAYEDYQGPDNASILLSLGLPQVGPVSVRATYQNVGFDDFDEMFALDNALLLVEGRYQINPWLFGLVELSRLWRLQGDGNYETVSDWQIGAGVAVGF